MGEAFQAIGLGILFILGIGLLFFLLSLVGGMTNTTYHVKGVGEIKPTRITKEDVEGFSKFTKSSVNKIFKNKYEKIKIDIDTYFVKDDEASVLTAHKIIYYGNLLSKEYSQNNNTSFTTTISVSNENGDLTLMKKYYSVIFRDSYDTDLTYFAIGLTLNEFSKKIQLINLPELSKKL